jgi:hypothetical protein
MHVTNLQVGMLQEEEEEEEEEEDRSCKHFIKRIENAYFFREKERE